jgi:hypothetical protein
MLMMPHQKHPKNNPYFFPQFFSLVYEKKTHVKKKNQFKNIISVIKNYQYFIRIIFILNMFYQFPKFFLL